MKNKAYILNIKNHCNEKWSEMQPQNKGRYCMQCSREVVDFTKLDNKEIGLIIEQSKGRICGRMSVSQLDRPIEIPSKKNRSKLLKLLTAIFLIGSTGSVFATNLPSTTNNFNVSKNESNYKRINLKQFSLKDTIKGQVLSEFEEPLEAIIYVKELDLMLETDLEGKFLITLPKNFLSNYLSLMIEGAYHELIETRIYRNEFHVIKKFYLEEGEALTGEVVTTYIKIKWWQFWKRW